MRQSLERLMTRGYIAEQPLEALARLWFGALVAGAVYLVHAEDQPTAKADLTQSIARLLTGLRMPPDRPAASAPRPPDPRVLRPIMPYYVHFLHFEQKSHGPIWVC